MHISKTISPVDLDVYEKIRKNVREFQTQSLSRISQEGSIILDVAPQVHEGIQEIAPQEFVVETIDIDNQYSPTICGDICMPKSLPKNYYDAIFCTEVLEHVSNPFDAIKNLFSSLKPKGLIFLSSPFGFRIHGPLPDNWRISEHGWKELLKEFEYVEIAALEDPERFLMPLHYCVTAVKGVERTT